MRKGTPTYFSRNAPARQPQGLVEGMSESIATLRTFADVAGDAAAGRLGNLRTQLGALLAVALPYFTFGVEPVLGRAAGSRSGSALLVELKGASPDLIIEIDGEHVLPGFVLHNFQLAGFCRHFDCRHDLRLR